MNVFSKDWWKNLIAADQEVNGRTSVLFGAMDEQELSVDQAGADSEPIVVDDVPAEPEPTPQAAAVAATSQDDMATLRAQLVAERSSRFKAEGEAFASKYLAAGKAMPAEQEALQAAYLQAAMDDATFGGAGRVGTLAAVLDARTSHGLTKELVTADSDMQVLANNTKTDGSQISEERKANLLAMTPLGQAAKNGHKN